MALQAEERLVAKCNFSGWDLRRPAPGNIVAGIRRVTDAEVFLFAKVLRVEVGAPYPSGVEVAAAAEPSAEA